LSETNETDDNSDFSSMISSEISQKFTKNRRLLNAPPGIGKTVILHEFFRKYMESDASQNEMKTIILVAPLKSTV
jgi:Cdc6-like AAA superfamily ATPase